ncbi:MAG: class II glutamine amidotransferase [Bacteroidales bacterium]|nr:class II glutamine amidotransferase [Bacteroidales bacterium]
MCCILYVPSGIKIPPTNTLKAIHRANPHGIGFADAEGNHGKTLDLSCFLQAIKKRHKDAACIIHFRLATHGSISEKNCHPFHDPATGIWFAHNGVLPIPSHDDMTDSEIFFREGFLNALDNSRLSFNDPELWRYVEQVRGSSRFIFMRGDTVVKLGQWHTRNGVFYSNLNWLYLSY